MALMMRSFSVMDTWFAPAGLRDDRQALSKRRIGDLLVDSGRRFF